MKMMPGICFNLTEAQEMGTGLPGLDGFQDWPKVNGYWDWVIGM